MTDALIAFVEALPDGALVVDSAGIITICNAAASDMLQLRASTLSLTSILRSANLGEAVQEVRRSRKASAVELEVHTRPPRLVRAHVSALGDNGSLLVVLRDLTREQAIEKMRSDFIANASHEMRTPLASILGSIETLQGPARNDEKARMKFLDTMHGQGLRMKRLIDDLLTLSRIELNEHVKPSSRVSLVDTAQLAIANLTQTAAAANVQLLLTVNDAAIVEGDGDELLQVAQNLIENAIKYGGQGGRVEIRCRRSGSNGILSVRDFGKGIPDIHLPRLTERFYRVSTQESRARGGTGLGLAIVKHIVLRHRGKLDVASVVGEGSTFSVTIPLFTTIT